MVSCNAKKKKKLLFKNYTSGHTAAIHVQDIRCVSQFFKQHRLMPDGSSVPQVLTPCPSVLIRVSSVFSQFADFLAIGFTYRPHMSHFINHPTVDVRLILF